MRYLGIDFGTKKVGIAYSDESATLAFPYTILKTDKNLVDSIVKIIAEKEAEALVLGESYNAKNEENEVMVDIRKFKTELETKIQIPIYMEKEYLTSMEARRYQDKMIVDDSAAALILQRFLDKEKKR